MRVSERPRGGSTRDRILSFLLARLTDDTVQASRLAVAPVGGGPHLPAVCAPERLLREVAVKQAIIEVWLAAVRAEDGTAGRWPRGPCDAVVAELISLYADHPEFDRRWLSARCGAPPPESVPLRRAPALPSAHAVPARGRCLRIIKP
jgi:hypothetical protein